MKSTALRFAGAVLALTILAVPALAQKAFDPGFTPHVARPAFTTRHPKLLIDSGHRNLYNSKGAYRSIADLASADGFEVYEDSHPFTTADLKGGQVLVIADALGSLDVRDTSAAHPAFTGPECDAVRDWVKAGGGLLLVAEHAPTGAAARRLAARFGVDFGNGFLTDPAKVDTALGASSLVYTWENGGLGRHPITLGHDSTERVHRIETFTGQSILGPPGSTTLLAVSDKAVDIMMNMGTVHGAITAQMKRSAAGRAQAVAFTYGAGRVVVTGEAAMFAAQLGAKNGDPIRIGMNRPGVDNEQFALNVLNWLGGALK